ncbi:MAG: hypothetical protein NTW03_22420 [Verrucomicrobia bacterium]|nr:hypothetical protein [Verrucomicrobiota bacterium]
MKLTSKNISMPVELASFAEERMAAQMIPSFSGYVCDLVRREYAKQVEADVALLERAIGDVTAEEPGDDYMAQLYRETKEARAELLRRKRA